MKSCCVKDGVLYKSMFYFWCSYETLHDWLVFTPMYKVNSPHLIWSILWKVDGFLPPSHLRKPRFSNKAKGFTFAGPESYPRRAAILEGFNQKRIPQTFTIFGEKLFKQNPTWLKAFKVWNLQTVEEDLDSGWKLRRIIILKCWDKCCTWPSSPSMAKK